MITIPLRAQPSYEELRYCLRAIEQYHPEHKVLIIGAKPEWLQNCLHLPFVDHAHHEHKARSIYRKIVEAFKYCDDMLFFNDDHIILAPFGKQVNKTLNDGAGEHTSSRFEYYVHHKGPLTLENKDSKGTYTCLIRNTIGVFGNVMDYDTHCAIWYNKEKFEKLSILNWDTPHGYGIKTSYCVMNKIEGEYYPDLKFRHTIGDITGRLYFSTDDCCNLGPLAGIFPLKSKYER